MRKLISIVLLRRVPFCSLYFVLALAVSGSLFSFSYHAFANSTIAEDTNSAVILAYHRIGEDAYPDTSLREEQFDQHIKALISGSYNILPLVQILEALQNNEELPPKTIGLSFEGAYSSAYEKAMPILIKNKIPFSVFLASDLASADTKQYMSWNELKKLNKTGLVSWGLLPASYVRLSEKSDYAIQEQLQKAKKSFQQNMQEDALFFSYPFGEFSSSYKDIVKNEGFSAAFSLNSGVSFSGSDLYALPRFTMTENFGDLDRFQMITNALPLPAYDIEPNYTVIHEQNPVIGFTLPKSLETQIDNISCFASGVAEIVSEHVGKRRIELRIKPYLQEQRTRINCTLLGPSPEELETTIWRWQGMLFVYSEKDNLLLENKAPR